MAEETNIPQAPTSVVKQIPSNPSGAQQPQTSSTDQQAPGRIFEKGKMSEQLTGMDKFLVTMAQISALAGDAESVMAIKSYLSINKGGNLMETLHTLGSTLGTLVSNGIIDSDIGRKILYNALQDNGLGDEGTKMLLPVFDKLSAREKNKKTVHFRETTSGLRSVSMDPETGKLAEGKVPGTIPSIYAERLTSRGGGGNGSSKSSNSSVEPTIEQVQKRLEYWDKQEPSEQKRAETIRLKRKMVELLSKSSDGRQGPSPSVVKKRGEEQSRARPLVSTNNTDDVPSKVPQGITYRPGGLAVTSPYKKRPRQLR